jgi:hypothetical protein
MFRIITHFSKVELRILLSCNALDLYQRCVRTGVAFGAFVAQDSALAVQSEIVQRESAQLYKKKEEMGL